VLKRFPGKVLESPNVIGTGSPWHGENGLLSHPQNRDRLFGPRAGVQVTTDLGVDEVRIAFIYDAATLGRAMRVLGAAVNAFPGKLVAAGG
jgi:hypothetical protein